MLKLTSAGALAAVTPRETAAEVSHDAVSKYDIFEIPFKGPSGGNPFLDVQLKTAFSLEHRTVTVDGFYDGYGNYKVRFMPDALGE